MLHNSEFLPLPLSIFSFLSLTWLLELVSGFTTPNNSWYMTILLKTNDLLENVWWKQCLQVPIVSLTHIALKLKLIPNKSFPHPEGPLFFFNFLFFLYLISSLLSSFSSGTDPLSRIYGGVILCQFWCQLSRLQAAFCIVVERLMMASNMFLWWAQ